MKEAFIKEFAQTIVKTELKEKPGLLNYDSISKTVSKVKKLSFLGGIFPARMKYKDIQAYKARAATQQQAKMEEMQTKMNYK